MAVFPTTSLSGDLVKVRFLEESVPKAVNRRMLGLPRGVYMGFIPVTTTGSMVMRLDVDPINNFSLLKVGSSLRRVQVDIFTPSSVVLDFTGHIVFPVYVLATASYQDTVPASGKIFTRATPASGPTEISICRVDLVNGELSASTSIPTELQPPVAFEGQAVGFMNGGAIDELDANVVAQAEIATARTSDHSAPVGGTPGVDPWPNLSDRIEGDISGSSMADRLALRPNNIISNVHVASASATSVNVSGSFTETGRTYAPSLTIEAGGDETTEGAITDAPDHVCFVVNADTGQRIINSNREPVYARLSYVTGTLPGTEIRFFEALTQVDGNGTNPFATLQEGDIVLAGDGLFYEVETITDSDNAILGSPYQGTSASVFGTDYRRFSLTFETEADGAYLFPSTGPTNIQFVFPAYFRLDRSIFDGFLMIKRDGEAPQVPEATSLVAGKALLEVPAGLAGSVRTILSTSTQVGTDIHTLNFTTPGSVSDAGNGVANISVVGPTGPAGAPAGTGPTGPGGSAGRGYSSNNAFEFIDWTPTNSAPIIFSDTFDFSTGSPIISQIEFLYGGIAGFDAPRVRQRYQITEITEVSATVGRISARIDPGDATFPQRFGLFLGAAGQ